MLQIHTPDSSRYWLADSYEARHAARQEPMNIDKEFLRLWFRDHCDPYKDEVRARIQKHSYLNGRAASPDSVAQQQRQVGVSQIQVDEARM